VLFVLFLPLFLLNDRHIDREDLLWIFLSVAFFNARRGLFFENPIGLTDWIFRNHLLNLLGLAEERAQRIDLL